jgi:hypothetical protein
MAFFSSAISTAGHKGSSGVGRAACERRGGRHRFRQHGLGLGSQGKNFSNMCTTPVWLMLHFEDCPLTLVVCVGAWCRCWRLCRSAPAFEPQSFSGQAGKRLGGRVVGLRRLFPKYWVLPRATRHGRCGTCTSEIARRSFKNMFRMNLFSFGGVGFY